MIKVKNQKLKIKVYKKLREYYDKQLELIAKGKMKEAKKYEKLSDKLYRDNYYKIFEIKY